MSLDSHLSKIYYVGGRHDFNEAEGSVNIKTKSGTLNFQANQIESVKVNIYNWRHNEYIHNWFINNVPNGADDDCNEMYFDRFHIEELKEYLGVIIYDRETIENHLGYELVNDLARTWNFLHKELNQDENYESIEYTYSFSY